MCRVMFDFRKPGVMLYGEGLPVSGQGQSHGRELKERRSIHGAGFVTENIRREKEPLQIPELNTGFDVPYWYGGRI